jgi:hypothetical protein
MIFRNRTQIRTRTKNKKLLKRDFCPVEQAGYHSIAGSYILSMYDTVKVFSRDTNFFGELVLANFLGAQVFLEYLGTNLNFQRQYPLSVKIINFLLTLMVNIIILIFWLYKL